MDYLAQLRGKESIVREAFNRYTKLENLPYKPIIGMKDPWEYRNKAQMQLNYANGKVHAGLYAEGTHELVNIESCGVQHHAVNETIDAVRDILERFKLPIYSERKRNGGLRTIVARVAPDSGKVQVTLVTANTELHRTAELVGAIRRACPNVVSIAQNINPNRSSLVFGDKTIILWGEERLPAGLGEVKFELSPRAFFQLNVSQTTRLYDAAKAAAQLSGTENVIDAYCGTGTIALWLAGQAAEVRGIEVVPDAIEDARRNAKLSGADNATFYVGRSEELIPHWLKQGYRPDVIVVDPPRTGCDSNLLHAFLHAKPKRIVYVSCNPSTLAKDCKVLLDGGYQIRSIQPVDMFPQTAQVESVTLLEWPH
jgi:23S rRNA (uracil1939-C5)-methyltransferase